MIKIYIKNVSLFKQFNNNSIQSNNSIQQQFGSI